MSYTYEKIASNKVKLSFVVPAEQFADAVQKAYVKNRGKIQVPGFRKGKAPRKVIETMYGASVFFEDAVEDIFNTVYPEAVKAENIDVVDQPSVDLDWTTLALDQDLAFTAEVFVRPDVTLGDYKGLTVEVEKYDVTEDDITARIEQDRAKVARTVEIEDRPVADGDTVNLDYSGSVDGVKFEGGTAEAQTLKIGSNQFIPGFEAQMVGMNVGEEKDLEVTFPEQYHSAELAGKAAVFHVKVNSISNTEMPELDDDFAADVSDFDTFAAYRENVVKELTEKAEKNNQVAIENALVEKAVENAQVDIPEAMIQDQLNYVIRDMEMRMMYQGIRMEDYLKYTGMTMEQMRSMYRGEAESRTKTELVMDAIRKAEKVEPTEDEVKAQIVEQAKRMGQDADEFEKSLTEAQRGYLTDTAAVQKVVDLMKADCTVTEKVAEKAEETTDAE